jgi:hypothetical protein
MRILVGDKGNVDFEAPVRLTPTQQAEFFRMMNKLFRVVIRTPEASPRTDRMGDAFFAREWTKEEYEQLLDMEDLETVARHLGRTHMSVNMARGWFSPIFMSYVKDQGIDFYADLDVTKKLIAQFLEEKKIEQLTRRQERKERRQERRQLEDLRDTLLEKIEDIEGRHREGRKSLTDEVPLRRAGEELARVEARLLELDGEQVTGP